MKDAYYFSHDSNARYDPKILSMVSVYGMAGYGWYWVIIEVLREQEDYKFNISKEHSYNAIAMQCFTDCPAMKKFINDCINEFDLLVSDGDCFWSESLSNRMEYFEEKKQKRIEAARIGGRNSWTNRNKDKQSSSEESATVEQPSTITQVNKVKESKVKESKEPPTPFEEIKNLYLSNCPLLPTIQELTDQRKTLIKARWQKSKDLSLFEKLFEKANSSKFLTGNNKENWKASFDWLLNVNNMVKVLEGNYDNKKTTTSGGRKYENY